MNYGGRGRRPIWCSSTCRVEASIERRGNRVVGVQPRLLSVIDPPRKEPKPTPTDDETAVARVLRNPESALQVLLGVQDREREGDPRWGHVLSAVTPPSDSSLRHAAIDGPQASLEPRSTSASTRRSVQEWAADLEQLRHALVTGAIYQRELNDLAVALNGVLDAFSRRAQRR